MGLGSTTKKIQLLAERAEQLYAQLNEVREQIAELRQTVDRTGRQVDAIEREQETQRVLLEAIADEQGIDVDSVLTEAAIEDAEGEGTKGDVDGESVADGETTDGTVETGSDGGDGAETSEGSKTVAGEGDGTTPKE